MGRESEDRLPLPGEKTSATMPLTSTIAAVAAAAAAGAAAAAAAAAGMAAAASATVGIVDPGWAISSAEPQMPILLRAALWLQASAGTEEGDRIRLQRYFSDDFKLGRAR